MSENAVYKPDVLRKFDQEYEDICQVNPLISLTNTITTITGLV